MVAHPRVQLEKPENEQLFLLLGPGSFQLQAANLQTLPMLPLLPWGFGVRGTFKPRSKDV